MKYFDYKYSVKPYECSINEKIRIRSLFNILQEIQETQVESTGFGDTYCKQNGLFWVGVSYHLKIKRLPVANEKIEIKVWQSELKLASTNREFTVTDADYNILIRGSAKWAILDKEARKVQAISKRMPNFETQCFQEEVFDFNKIVIPDNAKETARIDLTVRVDDLDSNGHTNNAMYPTWCLDSYSKEFLETHIPREIRVNFKSESFLKDKVSIFKYETDYSVIHIIKSSTGDKEFAAVEFVWD